MFIHKIILLVVVLTATNIMHAQTIKPTYAEKLGYPKGSKVLIIDVEDAGMSFDSNEGAIKALTSGVATSCSVMMPCSWAPAFVRYLKKHPNIDAGLDLTITSERSKYRWGPLAGKTATPDLTDSEGYLWSTITDVVWHASPEGIEKEINTQLERARSMGFIPTFLDSHMDVLLQTGSLRYIYRNLAIKNHIPIVLPGGDDVLFLKKYRKPDFAREATQSAGNFEWKDGFPVLDDLYDYSDDWKFPDSVKANDKKLLAYKTQKYLDVLKLLNPGVTMIRMHGKEIPKIFVTVSRTRHRSKIDLLATVDPAFKKAITDEGIILTTWRELMERRMKIKD